MMYIMQLQQQKRVLGARSVLWQIFWWVVLILCLMFIYLVIWQPDFLVLGAF